MTYTPADAVSLANNEALKFLLDALDTEAREALVTTPAENTERIRDHQAVARTVADIRSSVQRMAQASEPKAPVGLA